MRSVSNMLFSEHVLLQFGRAVALNLHMNAVLHQFAEEMPLHIALHDTAGEVDGQNILETDDGAVGAGGKGLPHVDIETVDIGLHIRRHRERAHVGKSGGGIFILHAGVEGANHQILYEKRYDTDQKVVLGGGVGGDIAAQEFCVYIITHEIVHLGHDLLEAVFSQPGIDGRVYHGDKIAQGL